jgi:FAD/FMN-containing dehydrogenase
MSSSIETIRGADARTGECAGWRALRAQLKGQLLLPEDDGYDRVRRVWNGMVDKRPAIIVRCIAASDVVEAIGFAREHELIISVRGGGHNIAGNSVCDGGLMIDLSLMKQITVNPLQRTARAEPGLRLAEFDTATQAHGLATPMGINSETGIAGLTLGGGLGRLARKHGLACDNLISAEVVLADGRAVRARDAENADLLWGLRGGGGNFGVVTSFEYRLHRVGPTILGGLLLYELGAARDVLRHYRDFAAGAPDGISMDAVLLTVPDSSKMLALSICYIGHIDEGERALQGVRAFGPPAKDLIAAVPFVELQSSADPLFAEGRRYYWKAQFLRELDDSAIDTLLDCFERAPSAGSLFVLQQVGGAVGRIDRSATAYFNRDAQFDCFPMAVWDDPADEVHSIAWARNSWHAMRAFSTGGVYVNNLGDEGQDRVRAAYGDNYERLVGLKNKYDPTNLFRHNQNIAPAALHTDNAPEP